MYLVNHLANMIYHLWYGTVWQSENEVASSNIWQAIYTVCWYKAAWVHINIQTVNSVQFTS